MSRNNTDKSTAEQHVNNEGSAGPQGTGAGVALLVEGAFLAVGSQLLFPACGPNAEGMYMNCHYSQEVVSVTGAIVAVLAVAYLLSKKTGARRIISAVSALAGVFVIAVPTVIIGVCPMSTMQCHAFFLPASVLLGTVIAVTGVVGAVILTVRGGRGHVVASRA